MAARELGEKIYDVVRGSAFTSCASDEDVRRGADNLARIIKAAADYVADEDSVASELTDGMDGWEVILFLAVVDEMRRVKG